MKNVYENKNSQGQFDIDELECEVVNKEAMKKFLSDSNNIEVDDADSDFGLTTIYHYKNLK